MSIVRGGQVLRQCDKMPQTEYRISSNNGNYDNFHSEILNCFRPN